MYREQGVFSLCVMSNTVWEQVLPLYRKDIRNNMSVGGVEGRQAKGGREVG